MSDDTPSTIELDWTRRLDDLAGRATVDDEAWDRIQERIAASPGGARRRPRIPLRPTPRQLLAAAAIVILVAAVVLTRHAADERIKTIDDTTTTTLDDDGGSARTTTTDPDHTTSTAGPGDSPGGGGDGSGAGDGPGAGTVPGGGPGPGGGTTTPNQANPGGYTSSSSTTPAATAPLDGRPVAVQFASSENVVVEATVWQDADGIHMNIWQANPYRLYTTWTWAIRPGQNCLAGSFGDMEFPEAAPYASHSFSWGLARADAGVTVWTTGLGSGTPVATGSEVLPGLRPWISQHSPGSLERFTAGPHTATAPTWDAYPDTC
jgi:hypothetical protein